MLLPERITRRVVLGTVPSHRPELGPCWLWTGAVCHGYGLVSLDGKVQRVHRIVYEAMVGPIPEGLEPDHLCLVTACCCPWHIEPVTHAENMRRAEALGRGAAAYQRAKATCPEGHPYDVVDGDGRRCSACRRATARAASRRYRSRQALARNGG